jgi:predicted dehydrogenase
MEKVRWGILGTGRIANVFAEGLRSLPDAELVAVGSRRLETAQEFGSKNNVPHCHGSYEELAADSAVDAIYVSTPHPLHKDNSLLCINNGKAVLCEKPFTINAREAREVFTAARAKNVFVMEAMWTRFLPLMGRVRELLAAHAIGDVRMLTADFGFRAGLNPEGRLFNLALGGGALLDVGVYTVSFASMVMGAGVPKRIVSLADIGSTGIDEQSAYILGYEQGQLAILHTAVRTSTVHEGVIMGTEGRIRIHSELFHPTRMTLTVYGKGDEEINIPFEGNGFNYEAAEVMRCLRAGKIESDVLPADETISIMETMDQIRAPWGLRYPADAQ